MFNWMHCPLLQSKLSWPMRIMYSSGVWSYIVGAISTPTFIIIPAVTIWFGVFPIVVSRWTALGVTVYYFATNMVSLPDQNFRGISYDHACMHEHMSHPRQPCPLQHWYHVRRETANILSRKRMLGRCSTMCARTITSRPSGLPMSPTSSCGEASVLLFTHVCL